MPKRPTGEDIGELALDFLLRVASPVPSADRVLMAAALVALLVSVLTGYLIGQRLGYPDAGGAIGFWVPVIGLLFAVRRRVRASASGRWAVVGLAATGAGLMAAARAGVPGAEWSGAAGALLVGAAILWGVVRWIGYDPGLTESVPDDLDP